MAHLDDDTIALLALGEPADPSVAAHLAGCEQCRVEVESLAEAARVGRGVAITEPFATPEPRVWEAIARELDLHERPPRHVAPVRRRLRTRVLVTALAAVVVAAVAVTGAVLLVTRPASSGAVTASATLRAFPQWKGAAGVAQLETAASGERALHVELTGVAVPKGDSTELWLIDPANSKLVSLGDLRGSSGDFAVPRGVDLANYTTVDVSAEPPDGNPAHSGDSIVRGALRTRS